MVLNARMTEKRKPTYDLYAIKAAFSSVQGLRATGTAIRGAAALGFGRAEIVATIQKIERR
jgi:motility quorum-sensing regulator / GCU-specific mRNA interferase toxin